MKVSEVSIYGNKYRIRSELDEGFLKEAAKLVEDGMRDIEKNYKILTTSKIAIMAAFNLAAEYLKLKKEVVFLETKLDEIEKKISFAEG
ncbi:cell division protein ZapA [Deferribacter autotrophicus]|uniref:Cell division protein ZapA n=1 Tax=Deferribacter autotrophicus TaxID=500465 RepID=A0A5A8F153_9BACT|nr:cell division protein ZapA [Deferribacter autotrophicus]KAA0257009.1 cell division protein ZapA [Deferribacter autotrophicus]